MSIEVGDRVRVTEAFGIAKAGDVGVVRSFSETRLRGKITRNPIVDVPAGRGLVPDILLVPAPEAHAVASRPERVPLGDGLPPSTAVELSPPPPIDWCEAPERPVVTVKVPAPAWEPKEETVTDANPAPLRVIDPEQERGFQRSQAASRSWTPERRAKYRATMAAKRGETAVEPVTGDPADVVGLTVPAATPGNSNARETALSSELSSLSSVPLAGMRDELAAATAALRRAVASASIEGEDVATVIRLAETVAVVEKAAAGVNG